MPVGTAVPVGWYDFTQTTWIGEDNGRIIKVLGVDAQGKALVQVTTEARAATAAERQALGFEDEELTLLARTRAVGTTLWRVRMTHFTPWDCNWPWLPPTDAEPPPDDNPPADEEPEEPPVDEEPPPEEDPPQEEPPQEQRPDCTTLPGCEVMPTVRALGQDVDLPGTPFSLYYRSDRISLGSSKQTVRATGATMPSALVRIDVHQKAAGRTQMHSISRAGWRANQRVSLGWDGRDAYGRAVNGGAMSTMRVSYVYPAIRYPVRADLVRAFERISTRLSAVDAYVTEDRVANRVALSRDYTQYLARVSLPSAEVGLASAGSWALTGLRLYDPSAERLYNSGGSIVDAKSAQVPTGFTAQTQVPATDMPSALQSQQTALGADGALYFADTQAHKITRVWLYGTRKGHVETVAGTGESGYSGDGGPATAARLNAPTALALAPDGSIVFMDSGNQRLRRITPAGVIDTIAGTGAPANTLVGIDSVAALQVPISATDLAVSGDKTIWVHSAQNQFLQISPAGFLSRFTVPGTSPVQLAASPDGIVWLATNRGLYQFNASGILRAMPDTDGATNLLPDRQGGLLFQKASGEYSHLSRAGDITALGSNYRNAIDSGNATPLAVDAANHLISVKFARASAMIGIVGAGLPAFGDAVYRIPQADGNTVEEFDDRGRPIAQRSTFGGQVLTSYQYDTNDQLVGVTDSHGNQTTFDRDSAGQITAVTGPFGQHTTLSYSGGQLVQVQQPGGLTHKMEYASATSNLLTRYQDARGSVDRFSYTSRGRLVSNNNPAGGGWNLAVSAQERNFWDSSKQHIVTALSAEGRALKHRLTTTRYSHSRFTEYPDGTRSSSHTSAYGYRTVMRANGLIQETVPSTDSRLGPFAGQGSQTVRFANGFTSKASAGASTRNATDVDAWYNPLDWTQTTLLHGRDSWVTRYSSNGVFQQSSPTGRTWNWVRNAHQQIQSATLSSGLQLSPNYNAVGQLSNISGTDGTTTRSTGFSWHTSGGGSGRLASTTNAMGQTESFAYDAAGRLSTHTLIDGRTLQYTWDAEGNLIDLTTPAGITHRFNYNAIQLPIDYVAPEGHTTQWDYDRDRLLTRIVRPGGQNLTFHRQASGQLESLTDSAGARIDYRWNTKGQLLSAATDDHQKISYSYNGAQIDAITFNLQGTAARLNVDYESVQDGGWTS
ncbi:MAG: hypothetical protein IAF00_06345, partial [Phycisphaerales bacterium]|nr:hypothetical protein [Phycisphaerales bacterium]